MKNNVANVNNMKNLIKRSWALFVLMVGIFSNINVFSKASSASEHLFEQSKKTSLISKKVEENYTITEEDNRTNSLKVASSGTQSFIIVPSGVIGIEK